MRSTCGVIAVAALATRAEAGRTYYGWLQGTDVQPERGVELMTSIYEENEDEGSETTWWIGPLVGVTDRIELGFPLELQAVDGQGATFDRYGVDLRYRLVTRDPVEAPPFVPLLRVAVNHVVGRSDAFDVRSHLVLAYESGRLHVSADAGLYTEIDARSTAWQLRPGLGTSIRVTGDLRIGAEVYAQVQLDHEPELLARSTITPESEESWLVAGPNVAWTHGRIWVSAAYGIGLVGLEAAPKAQWGIAF
jgi:hypothetical protein